MGVGLFNHRKVRLRLRTSQRTTQTQNAKSQLEIGDGFVSCQTPLRLLRLHLPPPSLHPPSVIWPPDAAPKGCQITRYAPDSSDHTSGLRLWPPPSRRRLYCSAGESAGLGRPSPPAARLSRALAPSSSSAAAARSISELLADPEPTTDADDESWPELRGGWRQNEVG